MSVTPEESQQLYVPLHKDFDSSHRLKNDPPLLAHYTSVQVAEQIIKKEEIWFSHPFYMNDLEELRYGMLLGIQNFPAYVQAAADTPERREGLLTTFNHYIGHMNEETLVDTYVLCLSEHKQGDTDGVLSMWRSYASQGHGVALGRVPINQDLSARLDRCPLSGALQTQTRHRLRSEKGASSEIRDLMMP